MRILVKAKKVKIDDMFCRKILVVNAYEKDQLPGEYFNTYPNCTFCLIGGMESIKLLNAFGECYLSAGRVCTEEYFQMFISELYRCGDRLRDINLKTKRIELVWRGSETIEI